MKNRLHGFLWVLIIITIALGYWSRPKNSKNQLSGFMDSVRMFGRDIVGNKYFVQFTCDPENMMAAVNVYQYYNEEQQEYFSSLPDTFYIHEGTLDSKGMPASYNKHTVTCRLPDITYIMTMFTYPPFDNPVHPMYDICTEERCILRGAISSEHRMELTFHKSEDSGGSVRVKNINYHDFKYIKSDKSLDTDFIESISPKSSLSETEVIYASSTPIIPDIKAADCETPSTLHDKLVCGSPELIELDTLVAGLFREYYAKGLYNPSRIDSSYDEYFPGRGYYDYHLYEISGTPDEDHFIGYYYLKISYLSNKLGSPVPYTPSESISSLPELEGGWSEKEMETFSSFQENTKNKISLYKGQYSVDLSEMLTTLKAKRVEPVAQGEVLGDVKDYIGACGKLAPKVLEEVFGKRYPIRFDYRDFYAKSYVAVYRGDAGYSETGDDYILEMYEGDKYIMFNLPHITYAFFSEDTCNEILKKVENGEDLYYSGVSFWDEHFETTDGRVMSGVVDYEGKLFVTKPKASSNHFFNSDHNYSVRLKDKKISY